MIRLAKQYGWYGYRKVTALLRMEGWRVNHKRIERLWNEEGLQLPRNFNRAPKERGFEEGRQSQARGFLDLRYK